MPSPYTCALYPTIITPFFDDGGIDFDGLGRLIDHFAAQGCQGVFAVCQSSEMFFLDDAEKLALAAFSIDRCRRAGLRCVVSGHTQATPADQIAYLRQLEALGPDAIILVSNALAGQDEPDDALIANLRALCAALSPGTRLGMYECPYPYKRLLTPAVIDAMLATGRFDFLKDTCCEIDTIRARLAQLSGSGLALYNANSATLYGSLLAGAAGYSGVMLNFMPEIFAQLRGKIEADPPREAQARVIAGYISAASVIESQNYPGNAKHYLQKQGIVRGTAVRNGNRPLNESQRGEVEAFLRQNEQAHTRFAPHADPTLLFAQGQCFRSCHASTVLPLADGTVLAAYFGGDHEKANNVGIWLSRRVGGGWLAPVCIAKVDGTPHWNPVLFPTATGVRIVFKVGPQIATWRSWTMTSEDGGATWSPPVAYGEPNPAGGPVRSKPLRLQSGLLLAPNSDETADAWTVRIDCSQDDGAHFDRLADIPINRTRPQAEGFIGGKGAIQPTLWESAPGQVHALLRTTGGYIFRSDSTDGGKTWREAYSTGLPSNNSGIDIVRAGDALYLAMNPVGGNWAARTPLVILRSGDNGAHFTLHTVLADQLFDDQGERLCEFSYPAIVYDGQALHVTYTHLRRTVAYARVEV